VPLGQRRPPGWKPPEAVQGETHRPGFRPPAVRSQRRFVDTRKPDERPEWWRQVDADIARRQREQGAQGA
jgi:hypothetical protein